MKLFHGKETIVQQAMPAMPSICTPLGTVEFSLSVSNQSYLATDCAKLNNGGWLYKYSTTHGTANSRFVEWM
ncbi:hypothetical protein AB4Z30_15055 [Paenibacillus sp. 2TAF8]|uniref:hypothetical protein n=1 Tax=Paenibacillus sp. 2TAF8 TaxID=3233020 RepID=UPI003F9E2334